MKGDYKFPMNALNRSWNITIMIVVNSNGAQEIYFDFIDGKRLHFGIDEFLAFANYFHIQSLFFCCHLLFWWPIVTG